MQENYILSFRKRFGMSKEKFASIAGVSRNTVSRWERGITKIPLYVGFVFTCIALDLKPYGKNKNDETR